MRPPGRRQSRAPACLRENEYDMFNWDRQEYPYSDLIYLRDQELLTGAPPSYFSGSTYFNPFLRRCNRDWVCKILEGSSSISLISRLGGGHPTVIEDGV